MRWAGKIVRTTEKRNVFTALVRKIERNRRLEDRYVDGRIILIFILRIWDGLDWIDLSQDRDQWRALVNTVMNLRSQ
jgi:hypothetical protein